MPSQHQVIGEALATSLNGESFAEPLQASFEWVPKFNAEMLRSLQVRVVPGNYEKIRTLNRSGKSQHRYGVDVGVLQKVKAAKRESRIGELMGLCEEMMTHVQTTRFFGGHALLSQSIDPNFDVDKMEQHAIFMRVMQFQFRVCL